jgi:hypothetical protein
VGAKQNSRQRVPKKQTQGSGGKTKFKAEGTKKTKLRAERAKPN